MKKQNGTKRMSKWIYRILMLIAGSVFLYSAYQLGTIFYANHKESEEKEELSHSAKTVKKGKEELITDVNFEELKAINPDIIAWIYIPGTDISYAMVQGKDNSYYLNHTAANQSNYAGAIFLDTAAASDFSNYNSFIYGHSMRHSTMFTDIKKFLDAEFASKHTYVYILTPDKKYRCPIYSMYPTVSDSNSYQLGNTNEATQASYLQMVKGLSVYDYGVEAAPNEKLVTLSTCDFRKGVMGDERFLLHAILREWSE